MKRFLAIFVLCLAASRCFGVNTLVQSHAGGSASGSVLSGATITTSAGGFSGTTTPGSLLVLVGWTNGGVSGGDPSITATPISGGYSPADWFSVHSGIGAGNIDDGFTYTGSCFVFFISNASAMSASQTTTITVRNAGVNTGTISVEFSLYEFSGVVASPALDLATSDGDGADISGDSGTPGINWVSAWSLPTTTHTDLIICAMSAKPGSNITAGSGYTLGLSAATATIGQMEYKLSAAPGQSACSYTGTETFWAVAAIAFSVTTSSPTGVSRHRGQVF